MIPPPARTSRSISRRHPWLAWLLLAPGTLAAQERRALTEGPEVRSAVSKVKTDLLKADALLASCLPKRHLAADGADWSCKVGALRVAAAAEGLDPKLPLEKNKALLRRARLVSQALDTADALGFYKPPGGTPEDLPRWQVNAQAEACRAAQELFVALAEIPEAEPVGPLLTEGFPPKDAPRLAGKSLKEAACACHSRVLALGRAGFLNERDEVMARAQKQFYAAGCNVKGTGRESSLVSLKQERTAGVDLSAVGGSAKPQDVDRDDAQRVADRRKGELSMCVEDQARGTAAVEKLVRCACPMMGRWRFPKRETEGSLVLKVVVAEKLPPLQIDIGPKGTVDKCAAGSP
ncbi:MAG: hypothetical protein HY904_15045 [Deltaproteobacteria bacterium]|nr:hypothetical protein [Deltaproteobacteria bacterium]